MRVLAAEFSYLLSRIDWPLLDQLELQLKEAAANATEDELAAEQAKRSTVVKSFEREPSSSASNPRAAESSIGPPTS